MGALVIPHSDNPKGSLIYTPIGDFVFDNGFAIGVAIRELWMGIGKARRPETLVGHAFCNHKTYNG